MGHQEGKHRGESNAIITWLFGLHDWVAKLAILVAFVLLLISAFHRGALEAEQRSKQAKEDIRAEEAANSAKAIAEKAEANALAAHAAASTLNSMYLNILDNRKAVDDAALIESSVIFLEAAPADDPRLQQVESFLEDSICRQMIRLANLGKFEDVRALGARHRQLFQRQPHAGT